VAGKGANGRAAYRGHFSAMRLFAQANGHAARARLNSIFSKLSTKRPATYANGSL
jgi:hypothetical protein